MFQSSSRALLMSLAEQVSRWARISSHEPFLHTSSNSQNKKRHSGTLQAFLLKRRHSDCAVSVAHVAIQATASLVGLFCFGGHVAFLPAHVTPRSAHDREATFTTHLGLLRLLRLALFSFCRFLHVPNSNEKQISSSPLTFGAHACCCNIFCNKRETV